VAPLAINQKFGASNLLSGAIGSVAIRWVEVNYNAAASPCPRCRDRSRRGLGDHWQQIRAVKLQHGDLAGVTQRLRAHMVELASWRETCSGPGEGAAAMKPR